MDRLKLGIAATVVASAMIGFLLDVTGAFGVSSWFGAHQFASALMAEAILLGGTYLIIDEVAERRTKQRWQVASAPLLSRTLHLLDDGLQQGIDTVAWQVRMADPAVEWPEVMSEEKRSASLRGRLKRIEAVLEELDRTLEETRPLFAGRPELVQIYPTVVDARRHLVAVARNARIRADGSDAVRGERPSDLLSHSIPTSVGALRQAARDYVSFAEGLHRWLGTPLAAGSDRHSKSLDKLERAVPPGARHLGG